MALAVLSSMPLTVNHGFAAALGLALALPACKPKTATTSPGATEPGAGTSNDPSSSDDGASDGTPAATNPDAPPECAEQGEPWNGRQDTCLYEHHGCCYPDPASLCAAAGCNDGNCSILESHPAQAACG